MQSEKISEELLLSLTECKSLDEINVLSLRNRGYTTCLDVLKRCPNLVIAYLQNNRIITSDLQNLSSFKELRKLDLSNNKIKVLPEVETLSSLIRLKELYLHDNNLSKWENLTDLTKMGSLVHLTLYNNPVSSISGYRHYCVNSMPNLLCLDQYIITDEERVDNLGDGKSERFTAMNQFMLVQTPDFIGNMTAEKHIDTLETKLYQLRRRFENNSPIIRIQSAFRAYRVRKKYKEQVRKIRWSIQKIQKVWRGFRLRYKMKKELAEIMNLNKTPYLMMTNEEMKEYYARKLLKKYIKRFAKTTKSKKVKTVKAGVVQKYFRYFIAKEHSYVKAFNLKEFPWLYCLKEQKDLLESFIKELDERDLLEGEDYFEILECIDPVENYAAIRTQRPLYYKKYEYPILMFTMAGIKSKFRKTNRDLAIRGKSLVDFYCCYNNMEKEKDILKNKIKKRRVYYDKKAVAEMQDLESKNLGISRYFDTYDFLVFRPPTFKILQRLCGRVKNYNRNISDDKEPFILFFELTVQKVSAAIKIQCFYRNYVIRKRMRKTYVQTLIEWRASLCIQAYWRSYKFKARIKANSTIRNHMKSIQSNVLYLEENIYLNITYIFQKCLEKRKFKEQFFNFYFTSDYQCKIRYHQKFPQHIIPTDEEYWSDIPNALVHFVEKPCTIKDFNEIVDYQTKSIEVRQGLRFVEIVCSTVEDARQRASIFANLTYNVRNNSFIKLFTDQNLSDALSSLSNIREIWLSYKIKGSKDIKRIIEKKSNKEKSSKRISLANTRKQIPHSGFILHKEDLDKVDEKNLFEIQGDRKMKYMNVFFSVSEKLMTQVKSEIDQNEANEETKGRSIVQIKAQKRPELTEETFLSNRDIIVRNNRAKRQIVTRFSSPEDRVGTQLKPLRSSKNSLVSSKQIEEFQLRPETEKAHKRVLSSGVSFTKDETNHAKSKALEGFGISVRTLYGKHTPLAFSNYSAANTPAQEYAETSKSWVMNHKRRRMRENFELKSRIAKSREIGRIMKKLGQAEQDKNVSVFKNLVKEEKNLHKELIELDKNQRDREILRKRQMVLQAKKRRSLAQKERNFAVSFSQQKNMIVKHASLGEKRRRENEQLDKMKKRRHNSSYSNKFKFQSEESVTSMRSYMKSNRYNGL
ncbi:unnamed protein product [Moneuplotes crassus]|uniref:Leucine-rich repeat and IQ domain-containing protein 3 n=3 Tax=Euplotes crassus TaxID=5936 RepID=A0AAD1XH58_EUPCR|nr:unnamed protein product [Moneuplotes crassus]